VKVIFIEDVPDVALAGESREVADGYGRNYLLPKKLAVLANSAASNILEAQMKKVAVKRAQAAAEMAEIAEKINGAEVTIKAKVGEKERLYGSVTGADIADELNNVTGQIVDKRKIVLEEPIKQLGIFDVTVAFTHDITAAITVTVEAEKTEEEKEEKPEKKPRAKKEKAEEEGEAAAEEVVAEVTGPVEEQPEAEQVEGKIEEAGEKVEEPEAQAVEEKPARKAKAKKSKKAEQAEAPTEEPEAKVEDKPSEQEESASGE
jgi:large subunit ribosomal protein L9